jgi:hypothetical protein
MHFGSIRCSLHYPTAGCVVTFSVGHARTSDKTGWFEYLSEEDETTDGEDDLTQPQTSSIMGLLIPTGRAICTSQNLSPGGADENGNNADNSHRSSGLFGGGGEGKPTATGCRDSIDSARPSVVSRHRYLPAGALGVVSNLERPEGSRAKHQRQDGWEEWYECDELGDFVWSQIAHAAIEGVALTDPRL